MNEVWLIILCIFSLATYCYRHSFLLYFSTGALISFILSLFLHNLLFETICFLSCSLILLLIFKVFLSLRGSKPPKRRPSTQNLTGTYGIVTKKIGKTYLESGCVRLDHTIWPAISYSGNPIALGQFVEVKEIRGIYAIVAYNSKKGDSFY